MSKQSLMAHELGAFLRSRRTLLTPAEAGLADTGVRRTSGLRREEVAGLASISAGYYVRLEQGRVPHPSASVLEALAAALQLTPEERIHLFSLADQPCPQQQLEALAPGARRMLELLSPPTAAYVISAHSDVMAWNDTASALFGHLVDGPGHPNNVRYVFTHPEAAELFVDWHEIAADAVAHLRAATGHRPHDRKLADLVTELSAASAQFRALWVKRELRHKVQGRKELRHREVGRLTLDYVVLEAPMAAGQRLVAYSAPVGSATHEALTALRHMSSPGLPIRMPEPIPV